MDAKDYLQQLKRMEIIMNNKKLEILELKEKAMFPTAATFNGVGVQTSKSVDRMQNVICDYTALQDKLQQEIIMYYQKRSEIIQTIELLPTVQYDILHKVFVQGKLLCEIADEYNKTYSWVTTMQWKALKSLQKILDERTIV